jgi:hypothetical protein
VEHNIVPGPNEKKYSDIELDPISELDSQGETVTIASPDYTG